MLKHLARDLNDLFLFDLLVLGLSLFVSNTFVFGEKKEINGYVKQSLKMDIRGRSDQVRKIT